MAIRGRHFVPDVIIQAAAAKRIQGTGFSGGGGTPGGGGRGGFFFGLGRGFEGYLRRRRPAQAGGGAGDCGATALERLGRGLMLAKFAARRCFDGRSAAGSLEAFPAFEP